MAIRLTDQPQAKHTATRDPKRVADEAGNPRRRRRAWLSGCLGALVLGSTGCGLISNGVNSAVKDFHECVDESMAGYRNRALAEKAWIRIRHQYLQHQYHKDFKKGFVAGYMEVADGGNGCCPSIAPSEYWGWKYQSPYGQAAVNAWFEGYPLGAKAAEQDGVGFWGSIQMKIQNPQEPTYPYAEYPVGSGMPVPYEAEYEAEYMEGESLSEPLPAPSLEEPEVLELFPSEETEVEPAIIEPQSALLPVPASPVDAVGVRGSQPIPGFANVTGAIRPVAAETTAVIGDSSVNAGDVIGEPSAGVSLSTDAGLEVDELPYSFE